MGRVLNAFGEPIDGKGPLPGGELACPLRRSPPSAHGRQRADLEDLEADIKNEQRAAAGSIEGTIAFPAFVATALERRKRLRESIANIGLAIEPAREEVRAEFQEVKKYELARDNATRRKGEEVAKRERRELDELGVGMHRRKRMSGRDGTPKQSDPDPATSGRARITLQALKSLAGFAKPAHTAVWAEFRKPA